jgi:hypothetical protein
MTTRPPDIETNDLDLAAIYKTITRRNPTMYRESGDSLVTFVMPSDEITRNVILQYAAGTLELNVRRFASCRAWLYRQTREVKS